MIYWITTHIEFMDIPMFRINYRSRYHTGSYPILNMKDAMTFIAKEFGVGNLTYAMNCFRTEIAENLYQKCRKMETDKHWICSNITFSDFSQSYESRDTENLIKK